MKPDVVVGGDARLLRSRGVPLRAGAIEVPCQQCGRSTLLCPDGQRVALGEPEPLLEMNLAPDGQGVSFTPAGVNESSVPVECMWCCFADEPEILAKLPPKV